ncbi:MAG TPA: biosynthetic peptidoglycan transglycosylase [Oligoflexus sp.]|uniref:biosynthetic peptidoglycan transglycosylase n=1 Tax=Oligoflexus sp. TaxID=1971216 RepID=UPI002D3BE04E|nr:biosynthetic peptidoglycan transglycosylase [Oligoflexus sp.]HYX32913.1 biosynthetic peptidoglycan transglycosylase [Oligoflexus sp.]
MTVDAGKSSPVSKSKKIILSIGAVIVLVLLVLIAASQELEKRLVSAVEARLAQIEGLSFKIGHISMDLAGVHIDQITIRPAGQEDGFGLLLSGVQAKPNLAALIRGSVQVDQLTINQAAVLPHLKPALSSIEASIQPMKDSGLALHFKGQSNPGQLSGTIELDQQPSLVHMRGAIQGEGLHFFHPKIASLPLDNIHASLKFAGLYDKANARLQIDEVKLSTQGLDGILSGQIEQIKTKPRLVLALIIPTVPCQTLFNALPQGLIPDLQGFQLAGNFAAEYKLAIDFDKLQETQLTGYRGFRDCQTTEAPSHLSQKHLLGSFEHRTRLEVGINQTFQVGPQNPHYVPFTQFSDALRGAFIATEDISFFQHHGFVPESLSLAIGQNLLENRFAMGGSTITMQMVKNVFLSHEKTLSRKIQELFLTDYAERTLGKERILEIYLNVIEFGPGIFGIGSAAEHYFRKRAADLSPLESVYLASIIYSPRRHFGSYCRGNVSKEWDKRLRQLLQLMYDKELIGEDDFVTSQSQSIAFRSPPMGCHKNIEVPLKP